MYKISTYIKYVATLLCEMQTFDDTLLIAGQNIQQMLL